VHEATLHRLHHGEAYGGHRFPVDTGQMVGDVMGCRVRTVIPVPICVVVNVASGYVKIAIENDHL
jgi:hypothetical protein